MTFRIKRVDEPKLEVSLQEAQIDPTALPPKTEGGEAPAAAVSGGPDASAAPAAPAADPHAKLEEEPKKPSWVAKAKATFKEIFESLFSSDGPTRRTSVLFFVGILGMVWVGITGVQRIQHSRAERALAQKEHEQELKRLEDIENARLADLKAPETIVQLGRYVVTLQRPTGVRASGPAPTADFELSIRCSNKEVREYVEARLVQVRSELTSALVEMKREDFLAIDGKRRTHKKILLILNQWLAREYSGARIEDAWFTDLVVE
jgi:flagellar basal body-associated protein FliL